MPRFAAFFLIAGMTLAAPALALEARVAIPVGYADDLFLKTLAGSKALSDAGVRLAPERVDSGAEAMRAVREGRADLAVFTLAESDRRALRQAGPEAQLLSRPFLFKSAEEVLLMRKSFLGDAAANDAGRAGLLPIKIWTHAISYLLTREKVASVEDFGKLTLAAENGAPGAKVLASVGAKSLEAKNPETMPDAGNMKIDGFETQLGAATENFAAHYKGKLYLTVGWPETGLIAAGPDFWGPRSEAEKSALRAATAEALAASEAALTARDAAIRALPNVEVTRLDSGAQTDLAMKAAGADAPALHQEMGLWAKAATEVHAEPTPATPQAPMKMASLSPVFFATDRNDERTANLATRFGAKRLDPYEMSCGSLGAPARHSGEPKLPAAPLSFSRGAEDCARDIVAAARKAGMKKILFVIHGFNTTFEGLAWRALQVASELDYDGAVVGWSWPSEGSAFSYAFDEDSNTWSEPHLAELVAEIGAAGPEMQLDFVAHSMGNRILLQMLREFAQARSSLRIGAAIFAAPDVAQDVFRDQIRMARKIGVIRTLYASQYDHAILISESYHKAPRAGSGGDELLVVRGVESIDARLGGHSYLFDEPKAVQDFRQVVNQATVAAARGLEEREKAGAAYWVIEP